MNPLQTPGPEVVAATATVTDGQRAELARVREARLLALEALNRHPWWATVEDRHAAWTRLQEAARASGAPGPGGGEDRPRGGQGAPA